jgi:RNA polymerase subunit RPABC4/transcription elongation factor Spt4
VSHQEEEDDEELDDSEGADDVEDPGSADTELCPYCHRPIYDQAEICPHCGNYISSEDAPSRKSLWIVIGVVIALAVILLYWVL